MVVLVHGLALLCASEVMAETYATSFPLTENPLSENGRWIGGKSRGIDWADFRSTPGLAYGKQPGNNPGRFDDSTALLTGTWGPDQSVEAVVYNDTKNTTAVMEVEIRLRSTMLPHSSTGYEVYWSVQRTNPYLTIARWNGVFRSYTNLVTISQGVAVHTGDVVKASIVGSIVTAWINGVEKLKYDTARDHLRFSSGNPGIGSYLQNGTGINSEFGFKSIAATDGRDARLPPRTP
jgi:hypothetical protein